MPSGKRRLHAGLPPIEMVELFVEVLLRDSLQVNIEQNRGRKTQTDVRENSSR